MVKTILVEALIDDGAKLLAALDEREFQVETMFWAEIPEQDYWRLVIGSPGTRQGPTSQYYRTLQGILEPLDLAGLTPGRHFDIGPGLPAVPVALRCRPGGAPVGQRIVMGCL